MRFRLPHKTVYWPKTGADKNGRPTYGTPEEFDCRWEDGNTQTINGEGELVLSTTTVYLADRVRLGGMLMQGELEGAPADPRADRRCREIINMGGNPNLKGTQNLYIARLT